MICLNSKGLPLLEELKDLRAITLEDMDTLNEDLINEIEEYNIGLEQSFILIEPRKDFDSCVIDYDLSGRAIYSTKKIIEVNMSYGMTEEDARETFEYNTLGTFQGMSLDLNPPIFTMYDR